MKKSELILEASEALKNNIDFEYGVSYNTKQLFGTKQGLYEMKLAADWFMVPFNVKQLVEKALK